MEELLKELRESRDKLIHQDQSAKAALQQMQREMTYRVEQVKAVHVQPFRTLECNSTFYFAHNELKIFILLKLKQ